MMRYIIVKIRMSHAGYTRAKQGKKDADKDRAANAW